MPKRGKGFFNGKKGQRSKARVRVIYFNEAITLEDQWEIKANTKFTKILAIDLNRIACVI